MSQAQKGSNYVIPTHTKKKTAQSCNVEDNELLHASTTLKLSKNCCRNSINHPLIYFCNSSKHSNNNVDTSASTPGSCIQTQQKTGNFTFIALLIVHLNFSTSCFTCVHLFFSNPHRSFCYLLLLSPFVSPSWFLFIIVSGQKRVL